METTLTGKVIHVGDLQSFPTKTGGTFEKREMVVETTNDQYPQTIMTEVTGKALEFMPAVNDHVTVSYDLRGRAYQKKDGSGTGYFNTVNVWKIEKLPPQGVGNAPMPEKEDAPF